MQSPLLIFITLLYALLIQNVIYCSEIENERRPVSIGIYEEENDNGNSRRPIMYACCENDETEYETQGSKAKDKDPYYCLEKSNIQGKEKNHWTVPASISSSQQPINVKLKNRRPLCEDSNRELIWIHVKPDDSNSTHMNRTSSHIFTQEGYFGFKNTHFYPSNSYCIQRVNTTTILVDLCKSDCDGQQKPSESTSKTKCLNKCCPLGENVHSNENRCTSTKTSWKPFVYERVDDGITTMSLDRNWSPHILHQSPQYFDCPDALRCWTWPSEAQIFRLLKNGHIIHKLITNESETVKDWMEVRPNERFYCYDTISNEELEEGSNKTQIVCFCGNKYSHSSILFATLYSAALFISAFFLFLAALVNCLLWRQQHVQINNWIVQVYIINLFLWDIFLGVSHLIKPKDIEDNEIHHVDTNFNVCAVIGGTAHYFFLSTFCWISILNLDLWRKFRRLNFYSTRSRNIRKFCFYVAFAFGVPAFIIAFGLVVEYLEKKYSAAVHGLITPQYGKGTCFLEDEAKWPYLYGPISGLLVLNICLFTSTIFSIYQISKNCRFATDNMHKKRNNQFKLFIKLFCVMGILWNFEVISYAVSKAEKQRQPPEWYWMVLDALNILQGVAIFFIFIWKRQVKVALLTQYPILMNLCCMPKTGSSHTSALRTADERKFSGTSTQDIRMSNVSQCVRSHSDKTMSQGSSLRHPS